MTIRHHLLTFKIIIPRGDVPSSGQPWDAVPQSSRSKHLGGRTKFARRWSSIAGLRFERVTTKCAEIRHFRQSVANV